MLRERKYPRVSEKWGLEYHLVDTGDLEAGPVSSFAQNISGGGLCFKAREALEEKSMVALEMTSPMIPSPILALARVVWCKRSSEGEGFDVGAEFWWIGWKDNDAQATMADYIRSQTGPAEQGET